MFRIFIPIVFAFEITKLASCLNLVKWKIDTDEASFDLMLANTTLHPEKIIDKTIAQMLESCASKITESQTSELSDPSANFIDYNSLLNFKVQFFSSESELTLSDKELEILDSLENYVNNLNKNDYFNIYLVVSFLLVIVFVGFRYAYMYANPRKWFKLE
ncbi:hypothetical protein SteCoe_35760 [Stentor coeruleus]|uniref:GOLD domain-containing protein n=1 Tax=Stentor coeruleus TaxID=5963 RepID=A0A1R2ARL2_9CILI|nr:hypothetical protein SteCoe_35760 [Stentor coeruleus]